jgi:hypothetical protein
MASHAQESVNTLERQQSAGFWNRVEQGYQGGEEMPIAAYAVFVGTYLTTAASFLYAFRRSGKTIPELRWKDIILLGIASHKLSRLITKDWVTSPLRAPFTRYQGSTGAGEVSEKSRGQGLQKAMGDLLTCPFCTGAWVSLGLGSSYIAAPELTRAVASIYAIETTSDIMQLTYDVSKKRALH